jgi:hypothetical protein
MFPCTVLDRLGKAIQDIKISTPSNSNFPILPDQLAKHRNEILENLDDFNEQCSTRIKSLLQSHKCHFQSIISNIEKEQENPWFINKVASEIIVTCFALYCDESEQGFTKDTNTFRKDFESLEQVSFTVLRINTFLYGPTFQQFSQSASTNQLDPVILLKIFYIILMNEGFFKECMRQYHMMHIRSLKKQIIANKFEKARVQMEQLKIDSLDSDTKNIQKLSDSLKLQLDAAHQRHTQTEALLKQKIADLLIEMDQFAKNSLADTMLIKDLKGQLQEYKMKLDESNDLNLAYEVKIRDLLPLVEKVKLLESQVAMLKLQPRKVQNDCSCELEDSRQLVQAVTEERDYYHIEYEYV